MPPLTNSVQVIMRHRDGEESGPEGQRNKKAGRGREAECNMCSAYFMTVWRGKKEKWNVRSCVWFQLPGNVCVCVLRQRQMCQTVRAKEPFPLTRVCELESGLRCSPCSCWSGPQVGEQDCCQQPTHTPAAALHVCWHQRTLSHSLAVASRWWAQSQHSQSLVSSSPSHKDAESKQPRSQSYVRVRLDLVQILESIHCSL